jgi:hypothetical protein
VVTWLKNLLKPKPDALRELGYPSLETLAAVGLTGPEFFTRYVDRYVPRPGWSGADMAREILEKFYQDYPELKP